MINTILPNFLRIAADKIENGECSEHELHVLKTAMDDLMQDEHSHKAIIKPLKKK